MNRKTKLIIALLSPFAMVSNVFAQSPGLLTISESTLTSTFSITSIGDFIGAIVTLLFIIAAILVFIYLIWGGLQWLTSGGDSASTQKARDRITAALVGLAIIALAYALIQLIQYFFGIDVVGNSSLTIDRPF